MALQVLRMGRLTALKKPQSGVTWTVVSDVFRRSIARTIEEQCAVAAEKATASFPARVEEAPRLRVRVNAMLKGLLTMEGGDQVLLPFVRLFDGDPSTFLWQESTAFFKEKQGDPLMPMLFSLGQHAALMAVAARLREGERLLAFLGRFVHRHQSRPDSESAQHSA